MHNDTRSSEQRLNSSQKLLKRFSIHSYSQLQSWGVANLICIDESGNVTFAAIDCPLGY